MKKSFFRLTMLVLTAMFSVMLIPFGRARALAEDYPNVSAKADPKGMFRLYNGTDSLPPDSPYRPENRKWAGVPNVAVTGNRIWAGIFTGGIKEPDPDGLNHSVVAVSDDGGKSWIDPYIVNDDPNYPTFMTSPWLSPEGRLFLFIETDGNTYSVYTDTPEAPLDKIEWKFMQENPDGSVSGMFSSDHLSYNQKPIVVKTANGGTEWLYLTRNYQDLAGGGSTRRVGIWVSANKGKSWSLRRVLENPKEIANLVTIPEPTAVALNDGRIMLLARIEKGKYGGMMRCYSSNNGKTWTDWEYDLPAPYRGPGSLFNVTMLPSGNLLMINNDNTRDRTGLTAYLSTDDGKTFPYALTIDRRASSYPDVAVGKDGTIHVINDALRYQNSEIRLSVFTEQDIINGRFADKSKQNMCVFRVKGRDLTAVNYQTELTYPLETPLGTVMQALPTEIEYTTSDGQKSTASGEWRNARYWQDKAGTYEFYFVSSEIASDVQDVCNRLSVFVTLEEEKQEEGGCAGEIGAGGAALGFAGASLGIAGAASAGMLTKKKRKNKEEKR